MYCELVAVRPSMLETSLAVVKANSMMMRVAMAVMTRTTIMAWRVVARSGRPLRSPTADSVVTSGSLTAGHARSVAEVDGNRTRRTGIARPTRFEGGGAHQVPRHLRPATYLLRGVSGEAATVGGGVPARGGCRSQVSGQEREREDLLSLPRLPSGEQRGHPPTL